MRRALASASMEDNFSTSRAVNVNLIVLFFFVCQWVLRLFFVMTSTIKQILDHYRLSIVICLGSLEMFICVLAVNMIK